MIMKKSLKKETLNKFVQLALDIVTNAAETWLLGRRHQTLIKLYCVGREKD